MEKLFKSAEKFLSQPPFSSGERAPSGYFCSVILCVCLNAFLGVLLGACFGTAALAADAKSAPADAASPAPTEAPSAAGVPNVPATAVLKPEPVSSVPSVTSTQPSVQTVPPVGAQATDESQTKSDASPDSSTAASDAKEASAKRAKAAIDPTAKSACDSYFPSRLQGDMRAACSFGGQTLARSARKSAQIQCRLDYGASARTTMACLIGIAISEDVAAGHADYKDKRLACASHYPAHTEVDLYLQESCLAGIYFPRTLGRSSTKLCREVTPERSFIGPCEAGLSLAIAPLPGAISAPEDKKGSDSKAALKATQTESDEPPADSHNRLCDRYFDHRQLHQGYRACLNARGLALDTTTSVTDLIGSCEQIVSDSKSELEKAACVVGASIYRNLAAGRATNQRFQKCGAAKVSYDDRNVLACLAAASFLDLSDKSDAERGCKSVFSEKKSASRGDCQRSLETL